MPDNNPSLEELDLLVAELNVQWQVFDELFTDANNYKLFDRTGAPFWNHLWFHLLDHLFVTVSRFFDPPKSFGKENYSLAAILEFQEVTSFRSDLEILLNAMRPIWERGIREWRNKRVSHLDMSTILGEHRLPDVPLSEVRELVEKITEFARMIKRKLRGHDVAYQCALTGWVPQILQYLELGVQKKDEKVSALNTQSLPHENDEVAG